MNTARRRWTFISYSRKDKEFALQFARELKSAGHFVWLDQLDIPTGARWDDAVERALRECGIFLVILTAASISSENVKDEIGYAIDHGKRIMPVLLEECDIPLRLRRFQYVDFTTMKFEEGVKRAKQLLEDFLTDEPMQDPTKMLREAPETSRTEVATVSSLPPQKKSLPYRWMLAFAALLGALSVMLIFRNSIFPPTPTFVATAVPTSAATTTLVSSEPQPMTTVLSPATTSSNSVLPIATLPGYDTILSAAFSPDGQTLATGSYSDAKLWRVSDGSLLRSIPTESSVWSVAFSLDNQTLATGLSSSTVKLWRVSDGSRLRTLEGLTDYVYSVALSPDRQTVAAGGYNEGVKLWQANDALLYDLKGQTFRVYSVVFSPDGQILASASEDYTVKLWRVSDGMPLYELKGSNPVAFSPDGQTVATGAYGNVTLWRVSDGAFLYRLPGHSSNVESVAFSPDGQTLVTGSNDIEIRRWHVSDGVRLYTWEENGEGVSFVRFSTDGRMMAAVYKDGTVKLWQVP